MKVTKNHISSGDAALWREAPYAANLQRIYDTQAGRPTSAPFVSMRGHIPRPKYPSSQQAMGSKNPLEYVQDEMYKVRPSSGVSESYVRRKFSVEASKFRPIIDTAESNKNLGIPGISTNAASIINRVVNYGKDTPAYLRSKGSARAQSAGHQRPNDISSNTRDKQLAMMYAEELIQKLDSVILRYKK